MTLKRLIYFAIFVAAAATMYQRLRYPETPKAEVASKLEVWVCPVHPALKFNKPGQCSVCGRDLVKQEAPDEP